MASRGAVALRSAFTLLSTSFTSLHRNFAVLEIIKALREAWPFQSTAAFVVSVAFLFGTFGAGAGFVVDRIAKKVATEVFKVRVSLLAAGFPEITVVAVYHTAHDKEAISPLGCVAHVEVVNTRPTPTKIVRYSVDVKLGGSDNWKRLSSVPPQGCKFYWLSSLENAIETDLADTAFDVGANRLLPAGDSVVGFMFFEWPAELRGRSDLKGTEGPKLENLKFRINLENSVGERQTLPLSTKPEDGQSWIDPVSLTNRGRRDLSQLPVIPFSERGRAR